MEHWEHSFWAQNASFQAISHYVFSEKVCSTFVRRMVYLHLWFCEVCFAFFSAKTRVLGMIILCARYIPKTAKICARFTKQAPICRKRSWGVVVSGFPVKIKGKGDGGGEGGRWGGVWGGDRQRNRQVNAQALSKRPFSNLPFSFSPIKLKFQGPGGGGRRNVLLFASCPQIT